jgi:hypothetical protein
MPIEIKELHIKINVDEGAKSGNSQQSGNNSRQGQEAIIAACVEEVMEVLEKQKER